MNHKKAIVAKANDLKNGEMQQVNINGTEVLLCKIDGVFHAVGAYCTHYGAPLATGVLSGDRIVCPWHHACFDAKSGDLLEPPARDALARFEVNVQGDDVIVSVPENAGNSRVPTMAKYDSQQDKRVFVIIGGGAAGNAAAQALREDGFQGRIVMITQENRNPYDRPNLSKDYLEGTAEPEWMPLRDREFYDAHKIEIMRETRVTEVTPKLKTVKFENGKSLKYDKLLVATGGQARKLDVPGADLRHIFTLRSFDDSDAIIEATKKASHVAIIGASFIGMEAAHSLHERGVSVTVIAPESVPFERVFGNKVGMLFQELHEKEGIRFRLSSGVTKFQGNGSMEAVVLENGDKVEADVVLLGVGVKPATGFLQSMKLHSDGSVDVDENFRAGENIYAAGDIARFPDWRTGEKIRIEHWRTAEQQGRMAAHNMAGKKTAYRSIPFFWTAQVGLKFRYIGHATSWDDEIVLGDLSSKKFIVLYAKNDRILAAAGNGRDQEMAILEELMRLEKLPAAKNLHKGETSIKELFEKMA